MDKIDEAILEVLKENGRASASEISRRVKLSVPAVAERIRKLEQSEVIRQYTVKINRDKIEKRLLAFIFVNIDKTENIELFRKAIIQYKDVLECHHVAGNYDYLLKVALEDTRALELFLSKKLKKIPGVSGSNTVIALGTLKEEINF
ncbi:MAG: Lrp/AsnC family transcriptional regulator, leucine-responsive regulatory protein [Clostridiales bacterium]|jgi:Lrp/AsnC family leucine-responsive transcriptional regulator|nr:Lrp/AsnC family transcriptional regulator, leucine-responsive regulatory protein [Clostridiales bacterium]